MEYIININYSYLSALYIALSISQEQLKQRQCESIEIAKAQGKYTGRKPIPIDWERFGKLYGEWKAKNITGGDFMRRMELSANTFYRRVREYEITHGIAEPDICLTSQANGNAPQSRAVLWSGKTTNR